MILILFYFALTLFIVGWVWLLVEAFKQSPLWGLAALFPPLAPVFGLWHFREQWKPTVVMVAPLLLLVGLMPAFGS